MEITRTLRDSHTPDTVGKMTVDEIIYFDNAATSWPKPEETVLAMNGYLRETGGSPGRSGHRLSIAAGRIMLDTRELLAELLCVPDSACIVYTKNATEALNIAISGLLKPGDHVITSGMEHNSVMRPLRAMETVGVELSVIGCSQEGKLDPGDVRAAIKSSTRAIFLMHASNVTGTIMPVAEIGRIARDHDLAFCVDAAQTAGALPIDVSAMDIDLLAFTGHKSLFGPQGTGGLYIKKGLEKAISPLMRGGTGSQSEMESQPGFMPDKYESGTQNAVGIAGLGAGIRFILDRGIDAVRKKEASLTALFIEGAASMPGVTVYGCKDAMDRMPIVSFNVDGIDPAQVSLEMDERFGIMSRPGLHCAPVAHRTIGTFPAGAVRFSFGYFNTGEQVHAALNALAEIAARR